MKRPMRRILALLLATVLTGAHWAVLQGAALAGMAVIYSSRDGVAQGLQETFGGEHPCPMCKAIKKARTEEQSDAREPAAPVKEPARLLGVSFAPITVTAPPFRHQLHTRIDACAPDGCSDRPPVPPPR